MHREKSRFRYIGKSVSRVDVVDKLRGRAEFADDIELNGMWHGAIVRAPTAPARLTELKFDPQFDWESVAVVTAADIPGENVVDMLKRDMPFIATDDIQYCGEPVALIAASSKEKAHAAVAHIEPVFEMRKGIYTISEIVRQYKHDSSQLHSLGTQSIAKGDIEAGFAEADEIVEGEYWTGHQEQLYLEPQTMIASVDKDKGVFIRGSMQCPYYIQPELSVTLDLPPEKIRVQQTVVGGAFGGKEDFPTLIAGYCALLAMKSGHPVKMVYDRNEDILYTTKRHPAWMRFRTGLKSNGAITAIYVELLLDGGAYTTISPVVLYRAILTVTLGYRCDNITVNGHIFRSNTFPNGAFRGFGAPQAVWGLESHNDRCVQVLKINPAQFRLKNALLANDKTATGQLISESMMPIDVLRDALKRSHYNEKAVLNSHGVGQDGKCHGIGISFFGHGSGFTGSGEAVLKSKMALELGIDNANKAAAFIRVSSVEMGQGAFTVISQIAADGLGADIGDIRYPLPDTASVPDSGPTVASRTTMVVGGTIFEAAAEMRRTLELYAAEHIFKSGKGTLRGGRFHTADGTRTFEEIARAYIKENGTLRITRQFQLPRNHKWDQNTFKGDAYPSYGWGCNVAEVEIDTQTLEINVKRVTACYDIGRVINPLLAKGQVEGGLTQALGYALYEKIDIRDGKVDASRMQTYIVPTAADVPPFDIHFLEYPYEHSVPGAKGVGEIPMDGLAPAIGNAVAAATGVRIYELPITPEKLLEAGFF